MHNILMKFGVPSRHQLIELLHRKRHPREVSADAAKPPRVGSAARDRLLRERPRDVSPSARVRPGVEVGDRARQMGVDETCGGLTRSTSG